MMDATQPARCSRIRWRRILATYIVGTLICAALYGGTNAYLSDPPTETAELGALVLVDGARHDFGRVADGAVLKHEFPVRNRGPRRIVLNRRVCGSCADGSFQGTHILHPGESFRIPVALNTRGNSSTMRRVYTVTTSDPRQPRIDFVVTAHRGNARPAADR